MANFIPIAIAVLLALHAFSGVVNYVQADYIDLPTTQCKPSNHFIFAHVTHTVFSFVGLWRHVGECATRCTSFLILAATSSPCSCLQGELGCKGYGKSWESSVGSLSNYAPTNDLTCSCGCGRCRSSVCAAGPLS